ncbi:MAG: helix-turn-helix transcriptional regulator [Verrucomicrobiota bacterium]
MASAASRLKALREAAGLSQRELARQIGQVQSNIRYWETTGKIPRSDVLAPMAKVLGVTVEELLGQPKPSRVISPGGRARQLFEAVSRMPRRQQDKVLDILEPFVRQQVGKAA